jgi:hypothetical protein
MTEETRFRILAGEHLPDGVASEAEFLEFFRCLLRAPGDRLAAQEVDVRVLCWCVPDGVCHCVLLRESQTGRLCCHIEIAIAMQVCPADLDHHASALASLLSEAVGGHSSPSLDELGDGQ